MQSNQKNGTREPAITVRTASKKAYANRVDIVYKGVLIGRFVYDHDNPKSWGARAWFEVINGEALIKTVVK